MLPANNTFTFYESFLGFSAVHFKDALLHLSPKKWHMYQLSALAKNHHPTGWQRSSEAFVVAWENEDGLLKTFFFLSDLPFSFLIFS